ncbi:hypothetical protein AU385_00750 [Bacillus halotolerans]|nr:hypothetical protein AU385_00750 [Bacillus halotolerans]
MKEYFTIGETARLNNISIQTLRYHDRIGVFKPSFSADFSPREEIRRVMNMEKKVLELIRGIHLVTVGEHIDTFCIWSLV